MTISPLRSRGTGVSHRIGNSGGSTPVFLAASAVPENIRSLLDRDDLSPTSLLQPLAGNRDFWHRQRSVFRPTRCDRGGRRGPADRFLTRSVSEYRSSGLNKFWSWLRRAGREIIVHIFFYSHYFRCSFEIPRSEKYSVFRPGSAADVDSVEAGTGLSSSRNSCRARTKPLTLRIACECHLAQLWLGKVCRCNCPQGRATRPPAGLTTAIFVEARIERQHAIIF